MALAEILVDLSAVPDAELADTGKQLYAENYLNKGRVGEYLCHDQAIVLFHEERFGHAFYDKFDRWCYRKRTDVPSRERIERIRWIGEIIKGNVIGSECWEVLGPDGREPRNRLYIVWKELYVVWLEPRTAGGWRFSSAYVKQGGDIRKYCRKGNKIWSH